MPILSLDPRLKAVVDRVRPGSRVADIGTDHGYVLAHLLMSGKCPSAIAADIADGPLESARQNLTGMRPGSVSFMRCDGLSGIDPGQVDDIIIAGMGGELIARILADASGFHIPDKRFVLQPMTRTHKLRRYLCEAGFAIMEEHPVISAGRAYTVLSCAFTGEKSAFGDAFYYIGRLPLPPDEAGRMLLAKTRDALLKERAGIIPSRPDAAQAYSDIITSIENAIQGGDPYGP